MIYLTYEDAAGHAIALRVRDIAFAYGVSIFVPPLQSRDVHSQDFRELGRWLSDCEYFMAVVSVDRFLPDRPPALTWEIQRATRMKRVLIVDREFKLASTSPLYALACLIVGQLNLAGVQNSFQCVGRTPEGKRCLRHEGHEGEHV